MLPVKFPSRLVLNIWGSPLKGNVFHFKEVIGNCLSELNDVR